MQLSRGNIQKQLSQTLAEATAQGYSYEDVLPLEAQKHFQEMEQLESARSYIKELEDREKDLIAQSESLSEKLKAKEAEIEEAPEEYKAAKVDLAQAEKRVQYYKQIADDATKLADRTQRKLKDAAAKQTAIDDSNAKIARLQAELAEQQALVLKLRDDNIKTIDTYEQLHKHDMLLIEETQAQLDEALSHAQEVEQESDQFNETFTVLVENLQAENEMSAQAINGKSSKLNQTAESHEAAVAELTALTQCLDRAAIVVDVYQFIFKTLADPNSTLIGGIPPALDNALSEAALALTVYKGIHDSFEKEGLHIDHTRAKLRGMATTVGYIFTGFDFMKDDINAFLARLRREPKLWTVMKSKFGSASMFGRFSLF